MDDRPLLESLLADSPDDVATWQTYADHLIERGERWGDVIARACAGKPDQLRQAEAEDAMVGALDGVTFTWRFGAIAALELAPDSLADVQRRVPMADALARVLAHPAGRLVRALVLGPPPTYERDVALVPVIAAAGPLPLLTELVLVNPSSPAAVVDALAATSFLPRLRILELSLAVCDPQVPVRLLHHHAAFRHLAALRLTSGHETPALRNIEIRAPRHAAHREP